MTLTVTAEQTPLNTDEHSVVRVAGTRVLLETVVDAFNQGASAEEITLSYPSLKLADVYAVITYYLRHKTDADTYIQSQERQAADARKRHGVDEASKRLRERLLARQASR